MSLEQTLTQTNELLKQVITILQSGISAPAELGQPEVAVTKRSPGRPKKEPAAGTVYWSIPKHNSVFAQEPGMAAPTMESAVVITEAEYVAKKAELAALTVAVLAQHTTTTGASTQATSAPSSPTAGAEVVAAAAQSTQQPEPQVATAPSAPAASAAESIKYADVLAKFKLLNVGTEPGQGRDGVMAVLKKFLPDEAAPTVSKIEALGRNAEVMAELDRLLKPAAPAADFDPLA